MIAELTGTLTEKTTNSLILNVHGVGYLIFCSESTLESLPRTGENISLKIETHVREDHIHLYGFSTSIERDWFKILQSVQGVGTRVALAILSVASPSVLIESLSSKDPSPFTQANGVGPKLAKRIVSELKESSYANSIDNLQISSNKLAGDPNSPKSVAVTTQEAISALVNLGYGRPEAFKAVSKAKEGLHDSHKVADLIRRSLTELT